MFGWLQAPGNLPGRAALARAVRNLECRDVMSDDGMELDPHGDLVVRHAREDDTATVVVGGEIDSHSAPRLEEVLLNLVGEGVTSVVIDLGGVGFIDSSGLRVLIALRKRLGEEPGSVTLRHATPGTLRLLEMTGLTEQFSVA